MDWFVSILENLVVFPHHAKLARPLLVSSLEDRDNRLTREQQTSPSHPLPSPPLPFPIVTEANVTVGFAFMYFTMASFIKPYILIEKEGKSQKLKQLIFFFFLFFNILFVVIGWYSVMFLGDAWLKSHLSHLPS